MANEIKIFENEEFGQIRIVQIGGEPYFVGKDIVDKDDILASDKIQTIFNSTSID